MSTRLRFTTARQILEAFPTLASDIDIEPRDETPLDFARKLLARAHRFDAITYAAYLLPRREAVWWGCQCVRAIGDNKTDAALSAAEAWVRDPEEETRRAALKLVTPGHRRVASTWLALAAGHSGGSVTPEGSHPIAALPHTTAVAVKAGIILAIARSPPVDQAAWMRSCVEAAIRFADGGDAKVLPPARAAPKSGAA